MWRCLSLTAVCLGLIGFLSVLKAQDTQPVGNTLIINSVCTDGKDCKDCKLRVKSIDNVVWCIAVKCNTNINQQFKVCVAGTNTNETDKCQFTGDLTTTPCGNNGDCQYFKCQQAVSGNCTLSNPTSSACTCVGQGTAYPNDSQNHGPLFPLCVTG